jgi:hypothetical protein
VFNYKAYNSQDEIKFDVKIKENIGRMWRNIRR